MDKTTNKLYGDTSFSRKRDWMSLLILIAWFMFSYTARGQEGGQGNTTIFGGAQMTFFQNYDFTVGGGGAQPGVILTERTTNNFGVLNFSGANLITTGANNANYVDGYVRKYGTGQFIFPVGDNGHVGQFAASADGTMGAYFWANPAVAVTSNLFTGTDYPPLPVGGPFPSAMPQKGPGVKTVSNVEYWDIDGTTAANITLTWDAESNVPLLTGSVLSALSIVGWDGTKWVRIPSVVDANSILGTGPSTVTEGSIRSVIPIVPNTYRAYTLAGMGPDLSPRISVTPNIVHGTTVLEIVVSAVEVGNVTSTTGGQITLRVAKNPSFSNFVFNPTQSVAGTVSVQNGVWTPDATSNPSFYVFTTSTVIAKSTLSRLVFYVTLTPGASDGSFPLPVSIPAGQGGGETNLLNNSDADVIQFFAN